MTADEKKKILFEGAVKVLDIKADSPKEAAEIAGEVLRHVHLLVEERFSH